MKVRKDTLIRTIVLIIAIVNQILTAKGNCPLPLEDNEVAELLSAIFTTIAALWAWWKNNSFTKAAIEADEIIKEKRVSK